MWLQEIFGYINTLPWSARRLTWTVLIKKQLIGITFLLEFWPSEAFLREGSLWTNMVSCKSRLTLQDWWIQSQFRSLTLREIGGSVAWEHSWRVQLFSRKEEKFALWITTGDNEGPSFKKFCAESFWNCINLFQDISFNIQETICVNMLVITQSMKAAHEVKSLPVPLGIMALGRNPKQD